MKEFQFPEWVKESILQIYPYTMYYLSECVISFVPPVFALMGLLLIHTLLGLLVFYCTVVCYYSFCFFQDCTVKFFDITNPRKPENSINTLSPVWRARYTVDAYDLILK